MDNLQPLLTGDNSFSDISVFFSKKDNAVLLLLGLALLERFRKDPNDIRYKMAIGRLVNLGFPIRKLKEVFGHDHRTLADWGRGLRVNDPEECCRIYAGRRGKAKITPAIEDSVRFLYRVLGKTVPKFRVMIQAEIRHCFQVKVCGECLRRIFRRVDAEDAAAAAAKKAAPPAVPAAAPTAAARPTQALLPTLTPVLRRLSKRLLRWLSRRLRSWNHLPTSSRFCRSSVRFPPSR